jgi:molecular chaperone HtpG
MSNHKFQVNLRGVIELLSQHLYSSPEVYIRELLQNAVDAVKARRLFGNEEFKSEINFHLTFEAGVPVLYCRDNGVGLTETEAHQFLSVIGLSSKSDELARQRGSFMGQFGIGLLSGFMVSDRIKVKTRSIKPGSPVIEWCGLQDGTYMVREIEDPNFAVGTEVSLFGNAESAYYFSPDRLFYWLKTYGEFLSEKIRLTSDPALDYSYWGFYDDNPKIPGERINAGFIPWEVEHLTPAERRAEWMNYARHHLFFEPLDCFPLETDEGKLKGVAFVHSSSYDPNSRQNHRVYLRGILLSESYDCLLPSSGFFVSCVVNAESLEPTASRESFQETESYSLAKEELGGLVKNYCRGLVAGDSRKLQRFLDVHQAGIKQLALYDERLFAAFVEHLPFETTKGRISIAEFRRRTEDPNLIRYAATIDDFRQLGQTAQAQSIALINAGYAQDCGLIERLSDFFPEIRLEKMTAARLEEKFDYLDEFERAQTFDFLDAANETLNRFGCEADVRKFYPAEIPAMYSLGEYGLWYRSANEVSVSVNPVWSELANSVTFETRPVGDIFARLCLNYRNPLIHKLCTIEDKQLIQLIVEILYIQSLLAGHHALSNAEQNLLNLDLRKLIGISLDEFWEEFSQ